MKKDHIDQGEQLKLFDIEDMKKQKHIKKGSIKNEHKGAKLPQYEDAELRRFATIVIEDRIKFCREKKAQDIDKCVCEAIMRWIKLFSDKSMEGSRELGKLRVTMVAKIFEEMKKDGKIKCIG